MDPITRVTAPTLDVLTTLLGGGGPTWGLVIIRETGRLPGTVYPVLERLERLGWLTSSWEDDAERAGPRRRFYDFTSEGRSAAQNLVAARATPTVPTRSAPAITRGGAVTP